jgi:hypothetical protein
MSLEETHAPIKTHPLAYAVDDAGRMYLMVVNGDLQTRVEISTAQAFQIIETFIPALRRRHD